MVSLKNVMVVGAGQMGAGIAQVAAAAGLEVILCDIQDRRVSVGLNDIRNSLDRSVAKGRMSLAEQAAQFGRIRGTTNLADAAKVDLVIEAIPEKRESKMRLFADLDRICPQETVFASNTSSLPITDLASATQRQTRFIGMHFCYPAPVMKLVEIIRGYATEDEVYEAIHALAIQMGKTPVCVSDIPGFVTIRVIMPMINEAIFALYERVATAADIDTVLKLGFHHPMGPLELADFIGLDTCLSIIEVLYEGFKDSKYRPCPLLAKMVQAGCLGRKTGRGFYTYE